MTSPRFICAPFFFVALAACGGPTTTSPAVATPETLAQEKKRAECHAVVAAINPNINKLKKAAANKGEDVTDLIKVFDEIKEATQSAAYDLAKLDLTVPEIQKMAIAYLTLCEEGIAVAREMALALRTTQTATAVTAGATGSGGEINKKLTEACAASASDGENCKALDAALKKIDFRQDNVSATIDAAGKVTFNNDAVKDAAASIVASFRTVGKALVDLRAAQARATVAGQKFTALNKRQGASIDALNNFCGSRSR